MTQHKRRVWTGNSGGASSASSGNSPYLAQSVVSSQLLPAFLSRSTVDGPARATRSMMQFRRPACRRKRQAVGICTAEHGGMPCVRRLHAPVGLSQACDGGVVCTLQISSFDARSFCASGVLGLRKKVQTRRPVLDACRKVLRGGAERRLAAACREDAHVGLSASVRLRRHPCSDRARKYSHRRLSRCPSALRQQKMNAEAAECK